MEIEWNQTREELHVREGQIQEICRAGKKEGLVTLEMETEWEKNDRPHKCSEFCK